MLVAPGASRVKGVVELKTDPRVDGQPISTLLEGLVANRQQAGVTLGDLLDALGTRAHGIVILVFALPCTVPMPYGIPTACGIAILLVSAQLLLAPARPPWLPAFIRQRRLLPDDLERLHERGRPLVLKIERFSHPRLEWATGSLGRGLVAVLCSLCGITLILPIPFIGNIPPAIAATVLAAGLVQRDGLVVVLGVVLFALAMALLAAAWWGILNGFA